MAVSLLFPPSVLADCSPSKVYSLYKKGIAAADIADTCDMDEDDVQGIIDKKQAGSTSGSFGDGGSQPAPPPRQAFCCDGYGNSRCPIVAGSTQIGSACFCPGQGYGVICR
jgi:hypothetical protein